VKLPRDVSGDELATLLRGYGYEPTRQTGSHLRLTRTGEGNEHHVTVPSHDPLRVGTLSAILNDVAAHLGLERAELVSELFGR
jgi:predicted RNA binding protein YcfA (HicA-like mRNA interferase family)